jgi:negative regulator of flagellin synthesis FlgM
MTINPISHVDPIPPGKRPGRGDYVPGSDRTDSINLSAEARERAELYQVVELIKSAPDMDDARIAELREKINDPAYINETVVNTTADNIMNAFGL